MTNVPPTLTAPTSEQIKRYAAEQFMTLTDEEAEAFASAMDPILSAYERLEELGGPRPSRHGAVRDLGHRPDRSENPYNAVVTRCEIDGESDGPLAGSTIGLKDNIAVAGVEMACGSRSMAGYVPMSDATVVTRLLDAGGTIVAKLNMDELAYSATGNLTATGPVRNPRNPEHLAGGSSGGAGAAVVDGTVDIALGCDQGGSIRIPASWCGCVGLKPTHGLVPYTGIVGTGHSYDHVGPLAKTVATCAKTLAVIAGPDPSDTRQRQVAVGEYDVQEYRSRLETPADDVRIGIVSEGFGHDASDPAVDAAVKRALDDFADAGASVESVSVPMHLLADAIYLGLAVEETTTMFRDEGIGRYASGTYDEQFAAAFAKVRRTTADQFLPTLKLTLTLGEYLSDVYHGQYYARAKNLARELTAAYDDVLSTVDVLALPTTPYPAPRIETEAGLDDLLELSNGLELNTAPFNVTGHPAISVPCGTTDSELPLGLQFVGERFDDATVLGVARSYEDAVEWPELRS